MGAGNDIYTDTKQGRKAGRDYVEAGDGNDILHGGGGKDRLFGDDGDDDISGEAGNDKLFGGAGDDTLSGQQGADRIFAGGGADTVIGGNGRDTAWLGAGDDLWRDSPQTGRIGSDKIIGGTGNDTIASKGGNDTLEGGAGADTFVFYGAEGSSQIIDFHPGEDTLRLVIDEAMHPEFVLTTVEEGLLLSWADGELSLIGLSEGDITLSDILFDLG